MSRTLHALAGKGQRAMSKPAEERMGILDQRGNSSFTMKDGDQGRSGREVPSDLLSGRPGSSKRTWEPLQNISRRKLCIVDTGKQGRISFFFRFSTAH